MMPNVNYKHLIFMRKPATENDHIRKLSFHKRMLCMCFVLFLRMQLILQHNNYTRSEQSNFTKCNR